MQPVATFKQIYFNPQTRSQSIEHDIAGALASLTASQSAERLELGDATMLPPRMETARQQEITQTFGADFATSVQDAPSGRWSGPVRSSYGLHLIFVSSKQPAHAPKLEEVLAAVLRDWTDDKRKANEEEVLKAYKKKYKIEIEAIVSEARAP